MNVTYIVVLFNYNNSIERRIKELEENANENNYCLLIVNNACSRNLSIKISRKKNIINSPYNLGYGGGNNLGAKYAKEEYLFILNPDVKLEKNTTQLLLDTFKQKPDAAIVAPLQLNKKGKRYKQQGFQKLTPSRAIFSMSFIHTLFPHNKIARDYFTRDLEYKDIEEVEAVPGSAFLIKKSIFEKAGRFDPDMFMYFEEADLGKRVQELGYELYINPKAKVVHYWSTRKTKNSLYDSYIRQSRFVYFYKHYGLFQTLIVELFCRISKKKAIFLLMYIIGMVVLLI